MDGSNSSGSSPSSVASDLLANRIPPAAVDKMIEAGLSPPVHRAQSVPGIPFNFNRSASLPEDSRKDAENGIGTAAVSEAKDDIEAHRPPSRALLMASFRGNLSISSSTREMLERMSENQVQDATKILEEVKQRRRKSGLDGIGSIKQNKRLSKVLEGENENKSSGVIRSDELKDELLQLAESGSDAEGRGDSERRFSKSLCALGNEPLADFEEDETSSNSEDSSDDDEEVAEGIKRGAGVKHMSGMKYLTQSLGALGQDQFGGDGEEDEEDMDSSFESGQKGLQQMLSMCSHDEAQLEEVDAIADETFVIPKPKSQRSQIRRDTEPQTTVEDVSRRPRRERRAGLMTQSCNSSRKQQSSAWKPLSSNQNDPNHVESEEDTDDEEERAAAKKKESEQQRGIGGFWNKLTSSFTADGPLNKEALQEISGPDTKAKPTSPKKEISGAAYFRRGKKKANKCQFLQAVACFNFALVRQREELGENHIDCGTTLNEIGVCWMMLGERYPALTAFEEALFIRQKKLGDGAMEVAEVTNNIWMILHEERSEMENMMREDEEEGEGQ